MLPKTVFALASASFRQDSGATGSWAGPSGRVDRTVSMMFRVIAVWG